MNKTVSRTSSSPSLARILPTRVRRNYRGGRLLDELEGRPHPVDSDQPENWIASNTLARNPGLSPRPGEGLTQLALSNGITSTLPALLESAPEFYLGAAHFSKYGAQLGFLGKLLDSAMRLHVQAHPTDVFARKHLASDFGKLEVYYILGIRDGASGTLRLGFQHAPSRAEWRRIIETQDSAAMDACFEPLPVRPGEMYIVPGGIPHAIGEGILMVEVMEPSDWVVRCEFNREGIIVPPEARFMNRGLDFCLDIFDYTSRSLAETRQLCQLMPLTLASGSGWTLDRVVGAERTQCFEINRLRANQSCELPSNGKANIVIQTEGSGSIESGGESIALQRGECCFVGANAAALSYSSRTPCSEWLICSPASVTHP